MAERWKAVKRVSWPAIAVLGATVFVINLGLMLFQVQQSFLLTRATWLELSGIVFAVGATGILIRADLRAHEPKKLKKEPLEQYEAPRLFDEQRKHYETVVAEKDRKLLELTQVNGALRESHKKVQADHILWVQTHNTETTKLRKENAELRGKVEHNQKMETNKAAVSEGRKQGVLKTRASDKVEPPPKPSDEDRRQIQDLRTLWELQGQPAVTTLQRLYEDMRPKLRGQPYWSALLKPHQEIFRKSIVAVEKALAHDSTMGLVEVRARFNAMLVAYFEAIRWLAQTKDHGDLDFEDEYLKGWRRTWSDYHYSFRHQLNVLETIPGHKGTLTYDLGYCEDRSLVSFVREAEQPRATPQGPSASDTEAPPSTEAAP
jgi:hypothetical protein